VRKEGKKGVRVKKGKVSTVAASEEGRGRKRIFTIFSQSFFSLKEIMFGTWNKHVLTSCLLLEYKDEYLSLRTDDIPSTRRRCHDPPASSKELQSQRSFLGGTAPFVRILFQFCRVQRKLGRGRLLLKYLQP